MNSLFLNRGLELSPNLRRMMLRLSSRSFMYLASTRSGSHCCRFSLNKFNKNPTTWLLHKKKQHTYYMKLVDLGSINGISNSDELLGWYWSEKPAAAEGVERSISRPSFRYFHSVFESKNLPAIIAIINPNPPVWVWSRQQVLYAALTCKLHISFKGVLAYRP